MIFPTLLRCSLAWKRSRIWMACGKSSVEVFQIQGAPSPRVAQRAFIPYGPAFGIARFRAPDCDYLGFMGFGRTIGLLTLLTGQFRGTHGNTGAVQAQIQSRSDFSGPLQTSAFIRSNLGTQRFGGSLNLFGIHIHSR